MIDHLTNLETNALITVFCISLLAGVMFALAVVAFVFDQLDRRSRRREHGTRRRETGRLERKDGKSSIINHQSSIIKWYGK